MHCPYCQHQLQKNTTVIEQGQPADILECFHCGGHWLPRGLANNLNLDQAQSLDSVLPQAEVTPPATPRCPVCQERLTLIRHDSVASGITVLSCPSSDGNFFPHGNLLRFKHSQEAKITYQRLWGIPINALGAVLLPVIAVLSLTLSAPALLRLVTRPDPVLDSASRAASRYSTPSSVLISADTVHIFFTTTSPSTAVLTLTRDGNTVTTTPFSPSPVSIHSLKVPGINPQAAYQYTIAINFPDGEQLLLGPFPLHF